MVNFHGVGWEWDSIISTVWRHDPIPATVGSVFIVLVRDSDVSMGRDPNSVTWYGNGTAYSFTAWHRDPPSPHSWHSSWRMTLGPREKLSQH